MRIKWLLGELGLPHEEKVYNFYNEERVHPDYLKINPGGTFPTVEDDGLILTESGAVINHVLRKYGNGRFQPEGIEDQAMVDQWMFWSEGNFAIQQRYFWDHSVPMPACISEPIDSIGMEGMRQAIKYSLQLELALRETGFVVGDDLTAADFMLSFPIYLADKAGWFTSRPKIRAYIQRILARPAFQAAIADTEESLVTLFDPTAKSWRDYEHSVEMWK
jgi:glutathione S-transferase